MTVATRLAERVGRAPVQKLAEVRMEESVLIRSIADASAQLSYCREEIGKAAERRDRLSVYRFSDLQSGLIQKIERDSRALLRYHRDVTPLFTGERPLPDGCGPNGRAA